MAKGDKWQVGDPFIVTYSSGATGEGFVTATEGTAQLAYLWPGRPIIMVRVFSEVQGKTVWTHSWHWANDPDVRPHPEPARVYAREAAAILLGDLELEESN